VTDEHSFWENPQTQVGLPHLSDDAALKRGCPTQAPLGWECWLWSGLDLFSSERRSKRPPKHSLDGAPFEVSIGQLSRCLTGRSASCSPALPPLPPAC